MKTVGKLYDFIQPQTPSDGLRHAGIYLCRRVFTDKNGIDKTDITALLWPVGESASSVPATLVYKTNAAIEQLVTGLTKTAAAVTAAGDNIEDTELCQFWPVDAAGELSVLQKSLEQVDGFYPLENWSSDGDQYAQRHVLLVADNQLKPLPRHRLLADLAGMDDYEFLQRLQKCFNIRVASGVDDALPRQAREFGLYVAGYWYQLRLIEGTWFHADVVSDLDVSVVHDNMIAPLLGITDPDDTRIAYTGADCDVHLLQQLVDSGQWQAVWLMPAPALEQMMQLADIGRRMPPHSVCFQAVMDPAIIASVAD